MKIILNNNRCKLVGNLKLILRLREHSAFCLRSPGAFFSPMFKAGRWDGKIRFITESGTFDTGKLPQLLKVIEDLIEELGLTEEEVSIVDERPPMKCLKIPDQLEEFKIRPYQRKTLQKIKLNRVGEDIPFYRGLINAATNAGKTLLSAAIHKMFKGKTLFLLNSKELLGDALEEIPKMIPGEVGVLASGHKTDWNNFMIVMVQTANRNLEDVKHKLASYPIVIVDEADLATSKTYKNVINHTFNSTVRLGLTGSAMADIRKKEKNERLRAIFGDIIYEIKNRELIDTGYSAEVRVYIHKGTLKPKKINELDFNVEYTRGIIDNKKRNRKILSIVRVEMKKNNFPLLIITKNHKHIKKLYSLAKKDKVLNGLSLDWVHHQKNNRNISVKEFKEGKTKILIGSYILKRGKNFPLMRSIINAGGGDSISGVLQILGRATRKSETKTHTNLHDFYDEGEYIRRHSKHRISTYKKEELFVKELFK